MRTNSLPVVAGLAALVASVGLGWTLANKDETSASQAVHAKAARPSHPEPSSAQSFVQGMQQAVTQVVSGAPSSFDEVLNRALAARGEHDPEIHGALQQTLHADPAARAKLMRRYEQEQDQQARKMLQSLLSGSDAQDVRDFSTRLVRSAEVAQRREGFELMASLPRNDESYRVIGLALAQEQDPTVLSTALLVLAQPAVIDPVQSRAMAEQVRKLANHPDPNVRGASLTAFTQWEKSGPAIESRVGQGLADRAPQVRQAALDAIVENRLRAEQYKAPLFEILNNASEDPSNRVASLHALNNFALSDAEYARYRQLQPQIERLVQEQEQRESTVVVGADTTGSADQAAQSHESLRQNPWTKSQ